jgi:DNA-binding beta-propeller fold protein YncE
VGVLIAPNSKRAWVAATHADVIAVIDLENLRVEDAWAVGKEPDGMAARFGVEAPAERRPAERRMVVTRRPS